MKINLFQLIILSLFLMISLVFSQTTPRYYWYYYVVDSEVPSGAICALAYDRNGFPHVAYRGKGGGGSMTDVRYATYDGNEWNATVIDPLPLSSGRVVMALDTSDMPHIVYHASDGGEIRHAYYNGESWTVNVVEDNLSDNLYYWISIKIDSSNILHMGYGAYYGDVSMNRMSYNTFDGTNYSGRELVEYRTYWSGKWNSMTFDSLSRPTTVYYLDTGDLVFGYRDQGVWETERIDSSGFDNNQGFYPTVELGSNQDFYVSFQSHTFSKIRLAKGNFGNWDLEDVIDLDGWGVFSTPSPMILDNQDNPHIAYYNFPDSTLWLTYKINGVWDTAIVDSAKNAGFYACMVLNPNGLPSIIYVDQHNGYLKLAVGSLSPPPDSDYDGLPDYMEFALGSDPLDLDTDDDGLSDYEEDADHNGIVGISETSPIIIDTDLDSLQDGTELGKTNGITPPQGLKGTDAGVFQPDVDPTTQTDPLKFDSDGDGISDGGEDKNKNGKEDDDETDPNNLDTDGDVLSDGLEVTMGTSPLDVDTDDDGLSDSIEDADNDGFWDPGETSPILYDTDADSLSDGLEVGVDSPVQDPDGAGKLLGTDIMIFIADLDTSTHTDPLISDTDGDSLIDGHEDLNINGRFDDQETDPLDTDSDDDQIEDGIERKAGSDPLDLDTDDDGIRDNLEDKNLNGIVDPEETSSIIFDTDNDFVSDGVEIGLTAGVPDPDGPGLIRGTDPVVFVADQDPNQNSDPLIWDTDEDGLCEGEEDVNFNGAIEVSETHFLFYDTDEDTLSDGDEVSFRSDPLNPENVAAVDTILYEDFYLPPIPNQWFIVDEGDIDAPSNWFIWDNALTQGSKIYGGNPDSGGEDPEKPGTYIMASDYSGAEQKIRFEMRSRGIESLGIMFNYSNQDNYYRLSMNREQSYRRLIKKVDGQSSVLELNEFTYDKDRYYEIIMYIVEGRIQVYFDKVRIFDIQDSSLTYGSVAFYSWKNPMSIFRNISVVGKRGIAGIESPKSSLISGFFVQNEAGKSIINWQIIKDVLIYAIELFGEQEGRYTPLKRVDIKGLDSPYIEGSFVDNKPWFTDRYKLVLYDFNNAIIEEKAITNSPAYISDFSLTDPFPNPSKGKLNLVFQSPENVLLRFKIYDILGRKVHEFETTQHQKSWKQVVWDGRDMHGNLVSKGIYIIQIQALSVSNYNKILWQDVKKVARIR